MKYIILFLLFITSTFYPQKKETERIIGEVISNFNRVKDYEVDVNITVDVEFLKVPESKAKIFFKQPDKISLKSDGFAMLPRNGFDFSPNSLFKEDYTALYEKEENIDGRKLTLIKIIPIGTTSEVILSTLWIDEDKKLIRKVESTTKTNGTFTIDFSYDSKNSYPLPSQMVFSFNIDKMKLPTAMLGDTGSKNKSNKIPTDHLTKGRVFVNYSNYKINKDLPDSVFE